MLHLLTDRDAVCLDGGTVRLDASRPAALMPGSFNPLHEGHTALAAAAATRLGVPVAFELSVANVDKPALSDADVLLRLQQFSGRGTIWLTRAATFTQKAELFPGTVFVLGHDTALRLIDAKYYGDDAAFRDRALRKLHACGTRFVVGGRLDGRGTFCTWTNQGIPAEFAELFLPLAEIDFRRDVSSTQLRNASSRAEMSNTREC